MLVMSHRNVLPSDYSHYFQLTAYMNRFVLCFITSSHHDCPLLQSQHDEDMKVSILVCDDSRFLLFQ